MGLCLPSSDIDVVIQISGEGTANGEADEPTGSRANSKERKNVADQGAWKDMREKSPLSQLGESLRADWRDQLSYLEVIPKTKVPLVKFTHAPTGISVDASFLKENGIQAATLMKTFMEAMPPLRPLIFGKLLVCALFLSFQDSPPPHRTLTVRNWMATLSSAQHSF